jgi:PAS domain S-box-containing protein
MQIRPTTRLVLASLCFVAAGVIAGFWGYRDARTRRLAELEANAQRCALAFQGPELAALTGTRADEQNPAYHAIKARLIALRAVHPTVRFVYLFRHLPATDSIIYLADSEPVDSPELSRPGDLFPEARSMPGLQKILREGQVASEGPVRDSFGEWVTAYGLAGDATGAGRAILGLDIAAAGWQGSLYEVGLRRAVYVWLLLGLPLAAYFFTRHTASQSTLIRKLFSAIEQSESAILIVNPAGKIEYANAGLCRQTGFSRKEIVGRPWVDFRADQTSPELLAGMVATVKAGKPWEGEWLNRHKDGSTYPVRGMVSPVVGNLGRLAGFIAVIHDVSEARQQEQKLREEKERAEKADRAKGAFLATMSHEVRTPINGIVGFANLLLDTSLTVEQRDYVQTIRTSGEALVHLTGDILDFSRIESGGLQLAASPCDPRAAIEDVLDIFAARAADNEVQLLHWVDPDVPAHVLADIGRLRQVLVNLVGNAVKFTPSGEIEISLRLLTGKAMSVAPFDHEAMSGQGQMVAELEDGSLTLEFAVRDTGIGISVEDRTKLFQPFSQLDARTMRRFGGAGLGLVISRNLVRLMGGDIWLESEPGRGSTFFFTLRCRHSDEHVDLPPADRLRGQRVAVVTASAGLRNELSHVLRVAGAQVVECTLNELTRVTGDAEWTLAVVDCDTEFLAASQEAVRTASWSSPRMFGLVTVDMTSVERQGLRRIFRMLLNKPLHHRTLVDILAKAAESAAGASNPGLPAAAAKSAAELA